MIMEDQHIDTLWIIHVLVDSVVLTMVSKKLQKRLRDVSLGNLLQIYKQCDKRDTLTTVNDVMHMLERKRKSNKFKLAFIRVVSDPILFTLWKSQNRTAPRYIMTGHVTVCKYYLRSSSDSSFKSAELYEAVGANNRTDIIASIYVTSDVMEFVIRGAAIHGNISTLLYLLRRGLASWQKNILYQFVIKHGRFEEYKQLPSLMERVYDSCRDNKYYYNVGYSGNIELTNYIINESISCRNEPHYSHLYKGSCERNHIDIAMLCVPHISITTIFIHITNLSPENYMLLYDYVNPDLDNMDESMRNMIQQQLQWKRSLLYHDEPLVEGELF